MLSEIFRVIIYLSGIAGFVFAIILLATGLAQVGEYLPIMAKISAGLFLLAIVIIANILNAKIVPGTAKLMGFVIVNSIGIITYLTL